jgi:hypothetical protein
VTIIIDPVRLTGLKQAAYVMGCIVRNDSEEQITRMLGGDEQLFDMWKSFLKHNQWMTETMQGWSVTSKGAMWGKRVGSAGTF